MPIDDGVGARDCSSLVGDVVGTGDGLTSIGDGSRTKGEMAK